MPDDDDIEVVRAFAVETVKTYGIILEDRRTLRVAERESLRPALAEFDQQGHPERIVDQYASLTEDEQRDAGLYGEQLRRKRELARLASDDLLAQPAAATPRPFSRLRIRRWLKRAKVLVGSLKGLVPGAEALDELLDLLDAALDRA